MVWKANVRIRLKVVKIVENVENFKQVVVCSRVIRFVSISFQVKSVF